MERGGHREAMTDEALMAELVAGAQEALQVLHQRHAALVYHSACRTLDRAAAEDVTQEVFLRVWQKAGQFDPAKGTFRTWLLQLTHRRVLNELRARGRRPHGDGGSEAALAELAAQEDRQDEALWTQFRKTTIQRALAALPKEQGQALRLAFFQDLTQQDVATFLAVPLGTAKSRIRLALGKLNTPLAALVATLVAGLGLASYGWLHHRAALALDERALGMLTGSRMEALRLLPAQPAGDPEENPHATYRAERGGTVVVFTLSHVPAPPAGEVYRLWRLSGGAWQLLGEPVPDAQGRGRILLEAPVQPWPEALRLTREPRVSRGSAPASPVLLWPQ